jgi:DNA-binding NarL/FixJ family response regulator
MVTVFVADDHAVVREGLCYLLEAQQGIVVVGSASTGRQAVDQVRQLRPDVVVMDVSMPDLNGIDATAQILKELPQTRVVILSMQGTAEDVYRALQAGAHGYLLKESAGRVLVEAVRSVHAGGRYLSDGITATLVADYLQPRAAAPERDQLDRLSRREREVLQLVVEGKSSSEIGALLSLSTKTVDTYRSRLMRKLEIDDLPALVKFAIQHGITSLDP